MRWNKEYYSEIVKMCTAERIEKGGADGLAVAIQQNVIHRPGVDAQAYRDLAGRLASLHALQDMPEQGVIIPTKQLPFSN